MSDVGLDVVEHVFRLMKIDEEWSTRFERLVWWGLDLSQRVWAEPCFEDDGFVIAGVHARTDLVSGLTDDRLGRLASFLWRAPLNGLVRDKVEPTRLQLACSVYVHAETRDWLQQVFGLAAAVQAALANELAGPLAESASLSCADLCIRPTRVRFGASRSQVVLPRGAPGLRCGGAENGLPLST